MKAILAIDVNEKDIGKKVNYVSFQGDGYSYAVRPMGEDARLKPLPEKKEVEVNEIEDLMHTEFSIEDIYTDKYIATIKLATDKLISLGWNACIDDIMEKHNDMGRNKQNDVGRCN